MSVACESLQSIRLKARRILREAVKAEEETGKPVVVTAHKNADPDAIAAAHAVRVGLRQRGVDVRLLLPEGMNQASKRVVKRVLGIEPSEFEDEPPDESGLAIVVDTASFEQLGELADFVRSVDYIVIDHHSENNLVRGEKLLLAIHDPCAKAVSEIMPFILEEWGADIDGKLATMLIAGIVFDTKHLTQSAPRTLRVVADLIDSGGSLQDALQALQSPGMEFSERVARLKAAQRLVILRADELLVAITHIKAFEASVARGLLDLGADAAIVVSVRNSKARVTGRAKRSFVEKTGLTLDKIMAEIGKRIGGAGGGHTQAAGAQGTGSLERVLEVVRDVLETMLRQKGFKVEYITPGL